MSKLLGKGLQILLVILAVVVAFLWNEGFFRDRLTGGEPVRNAAAAYRGAVARVESRTLPDGFEIAGTVRARRAATISARMVALIDGILVEEGARVRAGAPLVRLSAPDLESRDQGAQGGVAAAHALVEQASRDFERLGRLHAGGAATGLEREQAETALRRARGELARAEGESRAASSVTAYTSLSAPFDGIVSRRWLDPGALASPGAAILEVVDDASFRIEAEVAESMARSLRAGDEAQVSLGERAEARLVRITEIVPVAESASRTVLVKLEAPSGEALRAGSFARVRLRTGAREGLVLPRAALRAVEELVLVDVVTSEGRLESRWITPGRAVDERFVEVLAGLSAGETVALHE